MRKENNQKINIKSNTSHQIRKKHLNIKTEIISIDWKPTCLMQQEFLKLLKSFFQHLNVQVNILRMKYSFYIFNLSAPRIHIWLFFSRAKYLEQNYNKF